MLSSICMFGDSVVKGVTFDSIKQRYIYLQESFVNQIQKGLNISVENFAKFGCTIAKGTEILYKNISSLAKSDITILEFGGNDCDFDWAAIAQDPYADHLPNTPLSEFSQRYSTLIKTVRNQGGTPTLLSLPPLYAPRYFKWVSKDKNVTNILAFLGDVEYIYRWHEMYNTAVFRLGIESGTPVIDITTPFLSRKNYHELLCEDGIHPNKAGHALITRSIEAALA